MTHPFQARVSMTSREAVSLAVAAHCRVLEAVSGGSLLAFDDTPREQVEQDMTEITEALHVLCATVGTRENSRDIREVTE